MEFIAVLVLWILANAVYVDMRRKGEKGFKRLVAFWIGWPGTLVGMLSVEEASQPTIRKDDRDLGHLVQEIRRDRATRGLAEPSGPYGSDTPLGAGAEEEGDDDPDPPDPHHRQES